MNLAISTPHLALSVGTRGSTLARWQTAWVISRLQAAWPKLDCTIKLFHTAGDKILDKPLPEIGGKGLFTQELENALRLGEIDLAVHSLKDLPIDDAPGLISGAIGEREDARDVLISSEKFSVNTLPSSARVGTSSLRRAAQLLAARPDLDLQPLRGNVDTRVRKALNGDYDAIVLAGAGVKRLGLDQHITEYLSFDMMLPAPGQGALAVQCRSDDQATRELLGPIDHLASRLAVTAERAFLKGLGGGCAAPIAAFAQANIQHHPTPYIQLTGLVASTDGRLVIRVRGNGADPIALGNALAQEALARGATELLK